jgi:uncharacterized protein (TIGR01777 family)
VLAISNLDELSPEVHFDAIINLAGEPIFGPRWTAQRKRVLWNSRIGLTEKLVAYIGAAKRKPSVLISGSAIGYYGDRGDTIVDESVGCGDDFGASLCSAWERAAQAAEQHGVRVCLLRTGLVIGQNGGFLQRMLLPFRLGLGGQIGDGRQWMSWVHLADHVAMTVMLLSSPQLSGPFNATAPNPVTNLEFTQSLARMLKRPAIFPVPTVFLRLVLGEMASLLLSSQRVIPVRMVEAKFNFAFGALDDALRDVLGG